MSFQSPSVGAVRRRSMEPDATGGCELYSDRRRFRAASANAVMVAVGGHVRRAIDIVVSSLALVLLLPLLATIWMALRVSIGGPVVRGDARVGLGGRTFQCFTYRLDPAADSLGQFLHDTGLDRLPQLWNVLIGDMSCVGPRPVSADEVERYGVQRAVVISVRPGLTGSR